MEAIARSYINVRIRQRVSSIFLTFGPVWPAYPYYVEAQIAKKNRERGRKENSIKIELSISCEESRRRVVAQSAEIHWRLRSGISRFFPFAILLCSRRVHEIVVEATRDQEKWDFLSIE